MHRPPVFNASTIAALFLIPPSRIQNLLLHRNCLISDFILIGTSRAAICLIVAFHKDLCPVSAVIKYLATRWGSLMYHTSSHAMLFTGRCIHRTEFGSRLEKVWSPWSNSSTKYGGIFLGSISLFSSLTLKSIIVQRLPNAQALSTEKSPVYPGARSRNWSA